MKKVFGRIFGIVLWVVCLLSILIALNGYIQTRCYGVSVPMLAGYGYASVETGSMEPNIPTGSFIILKRSANYEIGDVVTYKDYRGKLVTHRIVSIDGTYVITRGDANSIPDIAFSADKIIGKVVLHVPKLGGYVGVLRSPIVILVLIVLLLLSMLCDVVIKVFSKLKRKGKSIADRKVELYCKRNHIDT